MRIQGPANEMTRVIQIISATKVARMGPRLLRIRSPSEQPIPVIKISAVHRIVQKNEILSVVTRQIGNHAAIVQPQLRKRKTMASILSGSA